MDFTLKYTGNAEEKMLIRKINDMLNQSRKTYSVQYSHFLTPAEQTLLSGIDEFFGYIGFTGGYEDAERRLCRICTEEYANDDGEPIVLLALTASDSNAEISHRDILGALMALGIKRETVGDIIAAGAKAQFFCHSCMADFIEMNLKKIGRYHISLKRCETAEVTEPERIRSTINVSSMRLDSVCAECFGLSRTKAAESIRKGTVSVNWLVCDSISKEIHSGDKISMRGKGKVQIADISGISKKGRLFVEVLKYV